MASNLSGEKQQLHQLIDGLPPEQVPAALRYLNYLSTDPMLIAMLTAPADDEPYTDEQRRQDEATITQGDGISHEEVLRELGA